MTTFIITRNALTTTVQADDAEGAIRAMAHDAGYASVADAAEVLGESEQDFIDAHTVEETDEDGSGDSFRACYFITPDDQGVVLLTGEDEAHLSDEDLIEAAIVEARDSGLIGSRARVEYDHETMEEVEIFSSEADVREGLRIGTWRR